MCFREKYLQTQTWKRDVALTNAKSCDGESLNAVNIYFI